jgi:hypothetical protein
MSMRQPTKTSTLLFLFAFALSFYCMGASFIESFVNYPTWPLIGANEFRAYHQALSPLIIRYLVAPMVLATVLTALLVWLRPAPIPRWALLLSVILQLITWVSTAAIQIPIQLQLSRDGLSVPLIDQLMFTNWWWRRVPHLINSLLYLWMMSRLLMENVNNGSYTVSSRSWTTNG